MFDTNKVANNIKTARTKKNMTQMNLADEMGVSYQAVSNWERGNSMPDISKLPELCRILDISFEKLVGESSTETDIAERLMQDNGAEVTLEEVAQVGQLVQPDKIESKVDETLEKEGKIPFSTLVGLAPFMDRETLGKMAEKLADIDFEKLSAIAPFVAGETMDRLVEKCMQDGNIDMKKIVAIAPFLSKTTIKKVVDYLIENGQTNNLVALAPFMGKEMFPGKWEDICLDEDKNHVKDDDSDDAELYDLDEDEVAKLAFDALEKGEDVSEHIVYMNEDDVAKLAFGALESGRDTDIFLDYMNEDDIGKLALRAFESGRETEAFLDYMCEDDVEKLAFKALAAGKNIECYLDYMDEDAIKRLLLQSIRK